MRDQRPSSSRAAAASRSRRPGSDPARCLGIVVIAAAGGTGLAAMVVLTGGGLLAALLSYSLGASLFAAASASWPLIGEAACQLRAAMTPPRRRAAVAVRWRDAPPAPAFTDRPRS
jgi:hypothetical protein